MIFVTVGTHEQPFDRLIKKIDLMKRDGIIKDEVFMQIGYSVYEPKFCKWKKIMTFQEMETFMNTSEKIITHGGPATFMNVLSKGKTPIVVPRLVEFGEHVNDHQLEFVKKVVERGYKILLVSDLNSDKELTDALQNNEKVNGTIENNLNFVDSLEKRIEEVLS